VNFMNNEDVIAALATPLGEGGIAIVRMSGNDSEKIITKIFKPRNKKLTELKSHVQYLGNIINPESNQVVDEVLVSIMRAPRSFTAEDVVEIYTHGGVVVARKVLELLISLGARIAEPGEFTKRAFLNGRIDLSQAESVIDVIRAKTDKGLGLALKQLQGELSNKITELRSVLLEILAHIEAEIDFPDEDIEMLSIDDIREKLKSVHEEVKNLIAESDRGKIYREGINVVIIGRPNVGKSSLLNALLREKRAIVTDIPGTTRDIIEEYINIGGIPVKIVDTAGIRDTLDEVEKIGVEKSKQSLQEADLILFVLDASEGITEDDQQLLTYLNEMAKQTLIIINKVDLDNVKIDKNDVEKISNVDKVLEISAKERTGLDLLEKTVEEMVFQGEVNAQENIIVTRARHRQAFIEVLKSIEEALHTLDSGMTGEFLSIDVKSAWENLGKITGETVEEDVLDKIFSEFCIGK